MTKFLRAPVSVRNAANVIVTATALVVVASAVLMRVLDHSEYPNIGRGWRSTESRRGSRPASTTWPPASIASRRLLTHLTAR